MACLVVIHGMQTMISHVQQLCEILNGERKKCCDSKTRCALYSSVVGEPVADERLGKTIRSGTSREEEAMMYLGPSMTIGRKYVLEHGLCY